MAVPTSSFQTAPTSSSYPRLPHPPERDLPWLCWDCATRGTGGSGSIHYIQGKDDINLKKNTCKMEPLLICIPENYLKACYEIADVLV